MTEASLESILSKLDDNEQEFLKDLIMRDALTGVKNRRFFDADTKTEILKADAIGYDISLLMIDIDNFKSYNDKYGHLEGDKILRKVAQTIQDTLRQYDSTSRYGGEEFAALLPKTTIEEAYSIAERVRMNVHAMTGVSISIGISNYQETSGDLDSFINNSDEALMQSKKDGKNRTTIYKPTEYTRPASYTAGRIERRGVPKTSIISQEAQV